jgi:hypothetical protein
MILAEWQVGQLLWSMLWFAIFFLWIWVVIMVFVDLFRSHDLSGWAKAIWTLFVLLLPLLGVFAYLIVRGDKIGQHQVEDARAADEASRAYIRSVASTPADDLAKLADLRDRGIIDDEQFETLKARAISS